MPKVKKGSFAMSDHWIRVHPQPDKASSLPAMRSHVTPRRVFLKMIVVANRASADALRAELDRGASFFDLARQNSADASAPAGGFLGAVWLDKMDPLLAAAVARLAQGATSPVIESRGQYFIFQRLPRDFREQAIALFNEAERLKTAGRLDGAIAKYREALQVNPHFLRALVMLGVVVGQKGEKERAIVVLEQAALLFPRDPSAHYNLGIAYGAAGRMMEEIASYRRALDREPDLVAAYQNLGAALFSAGQTDQAAETFLRGLDVNPLSATLYYNLGLTREKQGRVEEARRALALAAALGPQRP
jgi:tetratricopeptide (TPR) repeat protein